MAVVSYAQQAPLQGYYQWLQQQGLAACTTRQSRAQTVPTPAPSLPAGAYAQAGSLIRYSVLTTLSSVTVYFRGQFQTEAGQWQNVGQVVVGTVAGGIDQTILPATAGWYSNMVATVDTQTVTGTECYVLVELGRIDGGVFLPYAVLLSGYITTNAPIDSQAGPQTQNPPSSGGSTSSSCICPSTYLILPSWDITSDQGWQVQRTPAANTAERIVNVTVYGTMDVAVANRYLFVELVALGAGPVQWAQTPQTLVAATSYSLQALVGSLAAVDNSPDFVRPLPQELWWTSGYQVQIGIGNWQATDTVDDGFVIVEIRS